MTGLLWDWRRTATVGTVLLMTATGNPQLAPGQLPSATAATDQADSLTPPAPAQRPGNDPFLGSVASGKVTPEVLQLSIREAIDRGLKFNLGVILDEHSMRGARGARLKNLSDLLPHLSTRTSETAEQLNLAAFGLNLPGVPKVVGPFGVFDARATLGQPIVDLKALNNTRAATENLKAAELSYRDAREIVVLVVTNLYLQALAGAARVEAAEAQVRTAEAVYHQSSDLRNAGVAAGIDVLRSQVDMQARRQRLLSVQNDFSKQKLAVARAIGLPPAQAFALADRMPESPAPGVTLEKALADAYLHRADWQRAQALVRSAKLTRNAELAGAFPVLRFDGDYGVIGPTPGNSHGSFTATASLTLPIFQGGRVRAQVIQSEALLSQRKAEMQDLQGRIETEVRIAFLDLQTAGQQVEVAKQAVQLARQEVQQSRDRFAAGVAGSLEVTQAQEALAVADENVIASIYAHNVAKATLARAVGVAERAIRQFLGAR